MVGVSGIMQRTHLNGLNMNTGMAYWLPGVAAGVGEKRAS